MATKRLAHDAMRRRRGHNRNRRRFPQGHSRAGPEPVLEQLDKRLLLTALDLTTLGAVEQLDSVIFRQVTPRSTGTGVIDAFVRIRAGITEEGYNTDARPLNLDPVLDDVNSSSQFTRSLLLNDVPLIKIGGAFYREFWLDINEVNKDGLEFLSLDKLQIFLGTRGDLTGYPTFGGEAYKAYDLDTGQDNWVKLNYALNTGSGSGDMIAYIPDSFFTGPNEYIYLYSELGLQGDAEGRNWNSENGFEEWFVGASPLGEIHGYKFADLNGNGIDDGEPRLSGWTMFLDADDDGVLDPDEDFSITDANGEYHFTDLITGLDEFSTYRVREVLQADWVQTTPNPGDVSLTEARQVVVAYSGQVVLDPGEEEIVRPDLAFGNAPLIHISGLKFFDHDADAIRDPEDEALEDWTIELFKDENEDGIPQAGELVDSTVTGPDGTYSFMDLISGIYLVREVLPAGNWVQTTPDPGPINETTSDVDFGNILLKNISGQKFEDHDGDGLQDGEDQGLDGWTILLYADENLDGIPQPGELVDSTLTEAGGFYSFEDLDASETYIVREELQTGWLQTTPDPDPVSGAGDVVIDFGNFEKISISGLKFYDHDEDANKDPEDEALQGWTIELYLDANEDGIPQAGELTDTRITAMDGSYSFDDLDPGVYIVREVLPPGNWVQTTPNPAPIPARSGEDATGVDFGNFRFLDIFGHKFEDHDGDGFRDGEDQGLEGWTILLYADENMDGIPQDGELIDQALTGPGGSYSFLGLDATKTYLVREAMMFDGLHTTNTGPVMLEYVQTTPDPGPINETTYDVDFGNFKKISISGVKFFDHDKDAFRDPEDEGLEGWTIQLYLDANEDGIPQGGELYLVSITEPDGSYSFMDLEPGTYIVREVLMNGWKQTTPNPGPIPARSGEDVTGVDFGNFLGIDIFGHKFEDHDGDGFKDGEDQGLGGWTILLYRDDNEDGIPQGGELIDSTVTGPDGTFSFLDLNSTKTYLVREVEQMGWFKTTTDPGPIGETTYHVDFGNFEKISISGLKFYDHDADALRDPEDETLNGWTIQLYLDENEDGIPQAGELIDSTLTGPHGAYSFVDLEPGVYIVREVLEPGNWVQTTPNPAPIIARSGEDVSGPQMYFGNILLRNIFGQKFEDHDGDGLQDGEDQGLDGWTILLYADENLDGIPQPGELVGSVLTEAGGFYEFVDLDASKTYIVREELQMGWMQTTPDPEPVSGAIDVVIDFGNFEKIRITGEKFEDADMDGIKDAGELKLGGWTIELYLDEDLDGVPDPGELAASTVTAADGTYSFEDLEPGVYIVREVEQMGWMKTTADPAPMAARSGEDVSEVDFGNFMPPERNARTLGFWANKGQELITEDQLAVLRDLYLRNDDGTHFDPAAKEELSDWLLGGRARNMAYMLSVQLAAMQLNVLNEFVNLGDMVLIDGMGITIGDLMDQANTALAGGDPPVPVLVVLSGHPDRETMGMLKDALDAANNNMNWVFSAMTISELNILEVSYNSLSNQVLVERALPASLMGDLDGDGKVDSEDLSKLFGNWRGSGEGDVNGDGTVDDGDLSLLLANWSG